MFLVLQVVKIQRDIRGSSLTGYSFFSLKRLIKVRERSSVLLGSIFLLNVLGRMGCNGICV